MLIVSGNSNLTRPLRRIVFISQPHLCLRFDNQSISLRPMHLNQKAIMRTTEKRFRSSGNRLPTITRYKRRYICIVMLGRIGLIFGKVRGKHGAGLKSLNTISKSPLYVALNTGFHYAGVQALYKSLLGKNAWSFRIKIFSPRCQSATGVGPEKP